MLILAASSFILLASPDGSYPLAPVGPRHPSEADCRAEGEAYSSYHRQHALGGTRPVYICAGAALPPGPNKEEDNR